MNHEEDLISTHQKNQSHTTNHDSVFGCRTPGLRRGCQRERSGRWQPSPAGLGSAGLLCLGCREGTPPSDAAPMVLLPDVPTTHPRRRCPAHAYLSTSVACNRIAGGKVSPRVCAVLRLSTSSYFMGCSIGRSPGLAP